MACIQVCVTVLVYSEKHFYKAGYQFLYKNEYPKGLIKPL